MGEEGSTRSGPPHFSPNSVFLRVNRETLMGLSGSRAVLLELAHRLIAEVVARHSDFRKNRFRFLFRTLRLMAACCFSVPGSELANMAARHRPVQGQTSGGARYSAADPKLRLCVWATLIDSTLVVYERLIQSLTQQETDRFYEDARALAQLFDIPANIVPETWDDFRSYFSEMVERFDSRASPASACFPQGSATSLS